MRTAPKHFVALRYQTFTRGLPGGRKLARHNTSARLMEAHPVNKTILSITLMTVALILALGTAQPAEAASHGRYMSVQGTHGRGFTAHRGISRSPGSGSTTRGIQTHNGRGFETTRTTNHGNGSLTNQVTRTYNDGQTASRTGSITKNGNGSVTMTRSHTSVAGNTQTGWNTIYRTDDGITRTRGVTTSSGKSAIETGSVSFGNGSMTVNKSLTTGSGASASRSTTYTRGN